MRKGDSTIVKLEINSTHIPGTIMDKSRMGNVTGMEFLNKIYYITDGIMLAQIREICGIDGSTLQNWTKRGWVASAHSKRYNKNQLSRILIINMMRDSMQLDRISGLLTYVNGKADDTSDDIISESELYDCLCRIIDQLVENEQVGDNLGGVISRELEGYEERSPGARRRLERACEIMIMAYYSSLVKQSANSMYDGIFSH